MPVEGPTQSSGRQPGLDGGSNELEVGLATTNYGNQVAYNYGSISNYFCHTTNSTHECEFPSVSKGSVQSRIYQKIERARELFNSKRWVDAKVLLRELLYTEHPPPAHERMILQYNLAYAHFALAEFSDASRHFKDLVDIHEERREKPKKSVADCRYWLARSFYYLKRYEDASTELQVFVLTHDERGKKEAEQITVGRLWLGLTFERLGMYENAKEQLEIAYEAQVQSLGPTHLDTLASRHHLANFLYKRGDYFEASNHFDGLLKSEESLDGAEKAEAYKTRCMLAFCLAKLERYKEAEPYLQRALGRFDSMNYYRANEIRDMGLVSYWLGKIALEKGRMHLVPEAEYRLQRALDLLAQAMEIGDSQGDESRSQKDDLQDELLDCRRCLAATLNEQGQYAAAEQMVRQVIEAVDSSKPDIFIASSCELAKNLIAQRKLTEAKAVIEEVATASTTIDHCTHSGHDLAACVHLLGMVHFGLEQYAEAGNCFRRVVDVVPENPNLRYAQTQIMLGKALFELEDFASAQIHFRQAYDTLQEHYPIDSQEAQFWLGWSLCEKGSFVEAEQHLQPIVSLHPVDRGSSPISDFILARCHYYIGRVMSHRQDMREAASHFRIALPMLQRCFGTDDPVYLICKFWLAFSAFKLTDYGEARQIFEQVFKSEGPLKRLFLDATISDIRSTLAPWWLGRIAVQQLRFSDGDKYLSQALESLVGKPSLPLHPDISTATVQYSYAICHFYTNKIDECEVIVRKILDAKDSESGEEALNFSEVSNLSRWLLARCLYFAERFGDACEHLQLVVTEYETKYGHSHDQTALAQAYLADTLCELQRQAEAEHLLINIAAQQDKVVKAVSSYWLGHRAFNLGQVTKAEEYFTTSSKLLASIRGKWWERLRLDCRHYLARVQYGKKQYIEADDVFRQLAKQQYECGHIKHAVDNQYWLALSLHTQNKFVATINAAKKILDDGNGGRWVNFVVPLCHYLMGHSLYCTNQVLKAKPHFEKVLEFPQWLNVKLHSRFFLARANFQLTLYNEAKAGFLALVENGYTEPQEIFNTRYWLGRTSFELEQWDTAISHLETAHKSSKKEWQNALQCQYILGRALFAAGKHHLAASHFRMILTEQKNSLSDTVLESQYYLGRISFEIRKPELARTQFKLHITNLMKQKPQKTRDLMTSRYQLARCYVELGHDKNAQLLFDAVLPFFDSISVEDPTIVDVQFQLAHLAYRRKDWEKAAALFQEALIRHQTTHINSSLDILQYQSCLAACLHELHRYDKALPLFKEVIEQRRKVMKRLDQSMIDSQMGLSDTLRRLGKFSESSILTREALEWQEGLSGREHASCLPIRLTLAQGCPLPGLEDSQPATLTQPSDESQHQYNQQGNQSPTKQQSPKPQQEGIRGKTPEMNITSLPAKAEAKTKKPPPRPKSKPLHLQKKFSNAHM